MLGATLLSQDENQVPENSSPGDVKVRRFVEAWNSWVKLVNTKKPGTFDVRIAEQERRMWRDVKRRWKDVSRFIDEAYRY
jgi:hypothetical protein